MNRFVKIILAVLVFSFYTLPNSAFAQFAGPDKKIAREPGNKQKTTLGEPDGANNVCYIWTGPHIVGDANQAVITVNPQDTMEIYHVKRISKNGVEEDEAKVRVEDSIRIVSVYAKYQCYNHGDEIETSQFEIKTDPPGYENLVTVSPTVANNNFGWSAECGVPVTFSLTKNGHTSKLVKDICVFNSDLSVSQNLSQGLSNIERMLTSFRLVDAAIEDVQKCTRPLRRLKMPTCGWGDDPASQASGALDITPKMLCCSDHTMAPALQIKFGQLSKGASYGCRVPLYGIPYVATFDFVFNIGASVFVGPIDGIVSLNTNCAQLCFPFGATISFNGGFGGAIAGGDVLTIDGLAQASMTGTASYCLVGPKSNLKLSATVSLVGSVTMCSFVKYSIEFPLGTMSTTIDLE